MSGRQILVLFAFIVAAFILLAWRTEAQQSAIHRNADRIVATQESIREFAIRDCDIRNANADKVNALIDALAAAQAADVNADPATRDAWLEVFRAARLTPVDCP